MGLYGILVVTDASTHTAYPGVTYAADVPLLLSAYGYTTYKGT